MTEQEILQAFKDARNTRNSARIKGIRDKQVKSIRSRIVANDKAKLNAENISESARAQRAKPAKVEKSTKLSRFGSARQTINRVPLLNKKVGSTITGRAIKGLAKYGLRAGAGALGVAGGALSSVPALVTGGLGAVLDAADFVSGGAETKAFKRLSQDPNQFIRGVGHTGSALLHPIDTIDSLFAPDAQASSTVTPRPSASTTIAAASNAHGDGSKPPVNVMPPVIQSSGVTPPPPTFNLSNITLPSGGQPTNAIQPVEPFVPVDYGNPNQNRILNSLEKRIHDKKVRDNQAAIGSQSANSVQNFDPSQLAGTPAADALNTISEGAGIKSGAGYATAADGRILTVNKSGKVGRFGLNGQPVKERGSFSVLPSPPVVKPPTASERRNTLLNAINKDIARRDSAGNQPAYNKAQADLNTHMKLLGLSNSQKQDSPLATAKGLANIAHTVTDTKRIKNAASVTAKRDETLATGRKLAARIKALNAARIEDTKLGTGSSDNMIGYLKGIGVGIDSSTKQPFIDMAITLANEGKSSDQINIALRRFLAESKKAAGVQ